MHIHTHTHTHTCTHTHTHTLIHTYTSTHTLTQLSPLLLSLEFELLQDLLLLLRLCLQLEVGTCLHCLIVSGLERAGCFIASIHNLGDVVANALSPSTELGVAVHVVEVISLLDELLVAVCVCVCVSVCVCVCVRLTYLQLPDHESTS